MKKSLHFFSYKLIVCSVGFQMSLATVLFKCNQTIKSLTCDIFGNVYFSVDGSVHKFEKHSKKIQPLIHNMHSTDLQSLLWTENKLLYCSATRHSIAVLNTVSMETYLFENIFHPFSLCLDANGNVLFTDHHRVRKINMQQNTTQTVGESLEDSWSAHYWDSIVLPRRDGSMYISSQRSSNLGRGDPKMWILNPAEKSCERIGFHFKNYRDLCLDKNENLLIGRDNGLWLENMKTCKRKLVALGACNLVKLNWQGSILVAIEGGVIQLEESWKTERLLWIGKLKNNSQACWISCLPSEIIREIANWLIPPNLPEMIANTAPTPLKLNAVRTRTS